MQPKKLTQIYKDLLPVLLIGIFSFAINYHYGFIGIMPMDNTVLYNGGYRVLNGYIPFSDYWLVTGPLLDYLNALFFLILGISWKTFIIHSSFFNLLIAIASYFLFLQLELSKKFSLFYSLLISILFYPVVGTPFVDHHSTFFLILAFYVFIFAVKKKDYFYFVYIPFFFCLSFLSKQTPAVYGLIGILPLIFLLCFLDKNNFKKILLYFIYGSIISTILLIIFFIATNINIHNFIEQYILYAGSIGDYRISNYNFDILNLINKFKFINFFIFILLIMLISLYYKKKTKTADTLIILSSLFLVLVLIFHQYLTLNQNFIFFTIPYLCSIIHIFYNKVFNKDYFLFFFILICIFSVTKYHLRFNEDRKFNELEKIDLSKAIDAKILSQDFSGLKWITYKYPTDPEKELKNLIKIRDILLNDKSQKALFTDYQFLSSVLKIYDFSPNQWHHPSVSFPSKEQKLFNEYKEVLINNLKKNKIEFIYETVRKEETITELVLDKDCIEKKRVSEMLIKIKLLQDCTDLK